MTIDKTNPITGYQLVLMPGTPDRLEAFGWIQLLNGDEDAGYVHLTTPAIRPRLGSKGYIVTSVPMGMLSTMLDVLRHEKDLQISYFDSQTSRSPDVFIESTTPSISGQTRIAADPDIVAESELLRGKSQ